MATARDEGPAADTADRHGRVWPAIFQNVEEIMPPVTQSLIFTLRFGCHCYIHRGYAVTALQTGRSRVGFPVVKGKAAPLQAWSGPEGSRQLRFPDFMTTAQ